MSDNPKQEKPSRLMIWAAKKFAGLDDRQGAVLPPDRWFFKNFRAAVGAVPGANASLDRISSGAILTGVVLTGGALAAAVTGFGLGALVLGGIAASAAGVTGAVTVKNLRAFRHEVLPEVGRDMGRRFLKYQGEIIRQGWVKNREAARLQKPDEAAQASASPGKLTGIFALIEKAKTKVGESRGTKPPAPPDHKGPAA